MSIQHTLAALNYILLAAAFVLLVILFSTTHLVALRVHHCLRRDNGRPQRRRHPPTNLARSRPPR